MKCVFTEFCLFLVGVMKLYFLHHFKMCKKLNKHLAYHFFLQFKGFIVTYILQGCWHDITSLCQNLQAAIS